MVSRMSKGWKWFDLLAFFVVLIIVCVIIQAAAPNSGLAHAIHAGAHFLSILLLWLAGGLNALAGLLNQL